MLHKYLLTDNPIVCVCVEGGRNYGNHQDHYSEENFHGFGRLHKMQEDRSSMKHIRKP